MVAGSTSTAVIGAPVTSGSRSRRMVSTSGSSGTDSIVDFRAGIVDLHQRRPVACSLLPVITHLQGQLARMDVGGPSVELDVPGCATKSSCRSFSGPNSRESPAMRRSRRNLRPRIGLHIFYPASANHPTPVLVGFLRRAERDFFRKFISVEGLGPAKAAKAMNVSVSTIARAIEQEDRATLSPPAGHRRPQRRQDHRHAARQGRRRSRHARQRHRPARRREQARKHADGRRRGRGDRGPRLLPRAMPSAWSMT